MKIVVKIIRTSALVLLAAPVFASATPTLYEHLGGLENIREIVSETIERTAADPRTRPLFEGIRLGPVKESVANHLCAIAGGPCTYDGASMARVHSGMGISSDQFDLMDNYLGEALSGHGVKDSGKAAVAALLKPLKPEIIGK